MRTKRLNRRMAESESRYLKNPRPNRPRSHGRNRPRQRGHRLVPVVDNIPIARDTYRLRLGDATMAGRSSPVSS